MLKNFLTDASADSRNANGSNGHARLGGNFGARTAAISNLFVKASRNETPRALKAQLMEMCKQQNKPYGILIRKLDYPSSAIGSRVTEHLCGRGTIGWRRGR